MFSVINNTLENIQSLKLILFVKIHAANNLNSLILTLKLRISGIVWSLFPESYFLMAMRLWATLHIVN